MQVKSLIQGGPARGFPTKLILIATMLLSTAVVFSGCGSDDGPAGLKGIVREPPMQVGSISLPNENPATKASLNYLKGSGDGLMLVYFGYTYCPDVCPTTLADVRLAIEKLKPEDQKRVTVGMVTVDPGRDSGKVLNEYMGHFIDEAAFATFRPRDKAGLARAEKAFGASSSLSKKRKDGSYDVSHPAEVYAVDSNGEVPVEWSFGTDWEDIASDLATVLNRTSANAS